LPIIKRQTQTPFLRREKFYNLSRFRVVFGHNKNGRF
jgi:hypothetical protein